jgi:nitroreductase
MQRATKAEQTRDLILGRRSIRSYKPGPVSDRVIKELLEAAMAAPSAAAKDPWRFVIVRDRLKLEALAKILSGGEMLLQAGAAIAVCGDTQAAHDKQLSYLLQDCSAAIQNLLLSAHANGLGTCWLGVHPREQRIAALRKILALPESILPVACIALGRAAERKEPRTRYNAAFVHWETW